MVKYKSIYIICPYKAVTGGPELLHQLAGRLRDIGQNSYIVYSDFNGIVEDQQLLTEYSRYNVITKSYIEDFPENIVIIPEVYLHKIFDIKRAKIGCWWLSVDNYKIQHYPTFFQVLSSRKGFIDKYHAVKGYYKGNLLCKELIERKLMKDSNIFHLFQSKYAYEYIKSKGVKDLRYLSDFINKDLFPKKPFDEIFKGKEDIVLYNPKKGYEFTSKIIEQAQSLTFIPLQGLNRTQLSDLFQKAKLYIDFGNFPGKDRLPREAAINYCCIITGKNGASAYNEDLPIDESYKFETNDKNIPVIINRINDVLSGYNTCINDFVQYRDIIKNEETIFYEQINDFFN